MSLINKEISDFSAQAYQNGEFRTVTKQDVLGKWSLFFFYPADFTFVCPTELEDLQNNGEGVTFEAIAKPEWERGDHMTPLKKALEHEKFVTASIDAIYAAAYEARDFRAMQMLDWFIKEQGEEEKNAADLITKMELFGGDSKGLYMLNSELKARVYTAPSLVL